jgi:hypothetical protein
MRTGWPSSASPLPGKPPQCGFFLPGIRAGFFFAYPGHVCLPNRSPRSVRPQSDQLNWSCRPVAAAQISDQEQSFRSPRKQSAVIRNHWLCLIYKNLGTLPLAPQHTIRQREVFTFTNPTSSIYGDGIACLTMMVQIDGVNCRIDYFCEVNFET